MRDLRPVIFIEGVFVLFVSLLMLAPALIDGLAGNPDWKVFLISAGVALAIGGLMVTSAGQSAAGIYRRLFRGDVRPHHHRLDRAVRP